MLIRTPFIKTRLNNLAQEPDIHLGDYKGLFYKVNEEALECTESVADKLKLEECQFVKDYNNKFKTSKLKPFVLKWVSVYVYTLLECLYRIHLDKPSQKMLCLPDTPLNRLIYEWWSQRIENKIQIKWLKESETKAGLEAMVSTPLISIYKLLSRGLCLPVKPRKFKILREAVWGLRDNPAFRDDFMIDDKKLLKKDLLLYTLDPGAEPRKTAYGDAQASEYACMNINKLKIPVNLIFQRLFKYHFLLPLVFILKNFEGKHNYLLKEWLRIFHAAAIDYEILLSHYQIGIELSSNETGLSHIPQTIILNNYGAKSAIFHWSDLTQFRALIANFKSHNLYLIWGRAHFDPYVKHYFVDKVIETGCWLKYNYEAREIEKIYKKLKIPTNEYKVLAFYDEFAPAWHFTEEVLLDFWQMMFELIEQRKDTIGILKPKLGDENMYSSRLSDKGKEIFNNIRQKCSESGRFYFINNPREVSVTEVIAISDINITIGMCSPSTIALLNGKIGLYYDTTGNNHHPFANKYKNKLVFDNKTALFPTVDRIFYEDYNPLSEIDEELLRDYDHFRDNMGIQRFIEALLKNL